MDDDTTTVAYVNSEMCLYIFAWVEKTGTRRGAIHYEAPAALIGLFQLLRLRLLLLKVLERDQLFAVCLVDVAVVPGI